MLKSIRSLMYILLVAIGVSFCPSQDLEAISPYQLEIPLARTVSQALPPEMIGLGAEAASSNEVSDVQYIEFPEIFAEWVGSPVWMTGFDFGGQAFDGSIIKCHNFFGSSIDSTKYPPIEIVFSNTDSTLCQAFNVDAAFSSNGVGVFPGMAYDMTDPGNPRRLNIIFGERAGGNKIWDPDDSDNPTFGKREYLEIMLSDYDGTGLTYAGKSMLFDGDEMDGVYAWWPRVIPGHTLLEALPASIVITRSYISSIEVLAYDNQATISWDYDGAPAENFRIYSSTSNPPLTLAETIPGDSTIVSITGLTNDTKYFFQIEAVDSVGAAFETSAVVNATPRATFLNMALVSTWNGLNTYGDCWGYTDNLTGKEYALICARNFGVSIIDIDVYPPVEVGFMDAITLSSDAKDVKIYKNYAIVIKEYEPAQIFDLTDVTNPVQVSTISPPGGSGAHNCLVDGDYLYIVGDHSVGGVRIYDISNPASPSYVGQFNPDYYHDIDIRGNMLAGARIYGNGIDLVDITNKAAPSLITTFNYTASGAHNCEFSPDGNYLYSGDEIGGSGNHIRVWDISDVNNVFLASEINVDTNAVTHNCYIKDDTLLYSAYYTEGLRLWNIADPLNPFEIGYYDTYIPSAYGYRGAWSTYPYFASGKILISDMQTGLYVVRPDLGCSGGDADNDFVCDDVDNCLGVYNPGQEDSDDDGFPDACDNCPSIANPGQIDTDLDDIGDLCDNCCLANRGNANGDIEDDANVADVSYLVDYLFGIPTGPAPECELEANINGDPEEKVNVSDVSYMVAYLFGIPSGPAPSICP